MYRYYMDTQPTCCVDVLGTEYKIWMDVVKANDPTLEHCDGYCDKTVKRIVVADVNKSDFDDCEEYRRFLLRHELVHAFLFESGIGGSTKWDVEGEEHPEHLVEWLAYQYPKMLEAFRAVGAI